MLFLSVTKMAPSEVLCAYSFRNAVGSELLFSCSATLLYSANELKIKEVVAVIGRRNGLFLAESTNLTECHGWTFVSSDLLSTVQETYLQNLYRTCSYPQCLSIPRFPSTNSKVREQWEEFVSKQNGTTYKYRKNHGLCSAHFGARWVMPSGWIRRDAVPTIAPVSTMKVLCKWNLENSKLVRVEADTALKDVTPLEDIQGVDGSESVDGDSISDNCQEVGGTSSPATIRLAELAEKLNSPNHGKSLNSEGAAQESIESLDTVEGVEKAIKRERRLAVLRYQASMRKVQSLEVLLKHVKKARNLRIGTPSSCNLPPPTPLPPNPSPTPSVPTPSIAQLPKVCIPKAPTTSSAEPPCATPVKLTNLIPGLVESTGDSDLPPPLLDDYN